MTEDEMVGWHHRLDGHEFEQTPGDSEGQGTLVCCSPWGCRIRRDLVTEQESGSGGICKREILSDLSTPDHCFSHVATMFDCFPQFNTSLSLRFVAIAAS